MSSLILENFHCEAYLGATLEERQCKQTIVVSVQIDFNESLVGEVSDVLNEVVDYDALLSLVREFCLNNSFSLLEKLTRELGEYLRLQIKFAHSLILKISKVKTPVFGLERASYKMTWMDPI